MTGRLVVLRPEPGASRTVERGRNMGLAMVAYPLFVVEALAWNAPDVDLYDGLLLTSANAVRHGGEGLLRYTGLPLFAVGEATAEAARGAGLTVAAVGQSDAQAIVAEAARRGCRALLHPCGRDRRAFDAGEVMVDPVIVYAAKEMGDAAGLAAAVAQGDVVMVHSPRAGARLAALIPESLRQGLHVAAISDAALRAAGSGWASAAAVAQPDDSALLALGARLCE